MEVEAETIGLPFARAVLSLTRRVESTRANPGASMPTTGTRVFVTSLPADSRRPQAWAALIQSHWSIENKNHWRRDALWDEDQPRLRCPRVAQTLALLRGAILALLPGPAPKLFAKHSRYPSSALKLLSTSLISLN